MGGGCAPPRPPPSPPPSAFLSPASTLSSSMLPMKNEHVTPCLHTFALRGGCARDLRSLRLPMADRGFVVLEGGGKEKEIQGAHVPDLRVCTVLHVQGANATRREPEHSIVHQQSVLYVIGLAHYIQAVPERELAPKGTFASGMVGMIILLGRVLQNCFCFVNAWKILQNWLAKPVRSPIACRKVRNRRFRRRASVGGTDVEPD